MHSSRMPTGRSLTVCRSLLPGGEGVSAFWGVCSRRGGGGGVSASVLAGIPHPPVDRMTNRCKNITLATTSLRPVISLYRRYTVRDTVNCKQCLIGNLLLLKEQQNPWQPVEPAADATPPRLTSPVPLTSVDLRPAP